MNQVQESGNDRRTTAGVERDLVVVGVQASGEHNQTENATW